MVGTLLVIGMIAGFALFQYIKGGLITGFIFFVAVIVGIAVAFGYYELLAGYVKDYSFIGPKAYPLAFFITFIAGFIIIKEVADNLLRPEISFGPTIDKAGGVAIGALVGYLFAGAMLVVIGLAPYKTNWLYGRFEDKINNPPQASGILLNPDGFVTGLFGTFSNGSLKGDQSFAVAHTDYVDQIFLNRHLIGQGISSIARDGAVSIVDSNAPHNIDGLPEFLKSRSNLRIIRLQVNFRDLVPEDSEMQPNFTLSQLRLIAMKDQKAVAVYPVADANSTGQWQQAQLSAVVDEEAFKSGPIDVAFDLPEGAVPVLMEFRHNIIEEIRPTAHPGQPPAAPQPSAEPNTAEPNAAIPGA